MFPSAIYLNLTENYRIAHTTQWSPAILDYNEDCDVEHINVFGLVFYTRQLVFCSEF